MKIVFNLKRHALDLDEFETLTRILGTISDGWHEWAGPSPTEPEFARYFATHPQYRELVTKSYSQAIAYSYGGRTIEVVTTGEHAEPDRGRYAFDRAFDYLAQPLRLLVENEIADGHFYLRYLLVVDPDLAGRFSGARPAVQFDQGGGKMEVMNLVQSRTARATENGLRLRLAVVVDSDSKYPGHKVGDTERLIRVCIAAQLPIHATRKRAQENYIPDDVFRAAAADDPNLLASVSYILSLSSPQRDHYPVKTGLSAAEVLADDERTLYQNLTFPSDVRPKVTRIAQYFREKWGGELVAAHLAARGCLQEFESLADFIRGEL